MKDQIDYESLARALNSKAAFKEMSKYLLEGLQKSHRKFSELELLYGQTELGIVASESSGVITFTAASWAPKVWAGLEGALLDIGSSTLATQRAAGILITAIDIDARTVSYTGTYTSPAAGDRVYLKGMVATYSGSPVFNSMAGVEKILGNTGSLFGISAATYSLWKSVNHSAGSAALSLSKVGAGLAKCVAKGLDGEIALYVGIKTFQNLVDDQAALVRHVTNKGKSASFVNGADELQFHAVNGAIKVKPSGYVKDGIAFGLHLEDWKRIGSSDFTLKTPGFGDQIFRQLETKAGVEVRSYSNQAIICEAPAKQLYLTSIVNS